VLAKKEYLPALKEYSLVLKEYLIALKAYSLALRVYSSALKEYSLIQREYKPALKRISHVPERHFRFFLRFSMPQENMQGIDRSGGSCNFSYRPQPVNARWRQPSHVSLSLSKTITLLIALSFVKSRAGWQGDIKRMIRR